MMTRYNAARDFPALKGPSYLSRHLRFGTRRFAVRSEQLAMQCAAALAQTVPWHGYRNWSGISIWQPIMNGGWQWAASSGCQIDFLRQRAVMLLGRFSAGVGDEAKRLLVVEFPDIFQFVPRPLGLAVHCARFESA